VRGPISESKLQLAAEQIRENFGVPTHLFLSLRNQLDVDRILEVKHRVAIPMMGAEGLTAGAPIEYYRTSFGTFKLQPNVFITEEQKPLASPTDASAPAAPTTITAAATAAAGSKFAAADAGTYFYKVSYFTKSGESAGTALAGAVTVATGDKVTITMNGGTVGTVKGAKIFRSPKNAADASTAC
jgi:hypothetical protein